MGNVNAETENEIITIFKTNVLDISLLFGSALLAIFFAFRIINMFQYGTFNSHPLALGIFQAFYWIFLIFALYKLYKHISGASIATIRSYLMISSILAVVLSGMFAFLLYFESIPSLPSIKIVYTFFLKYLAISFFVYFLTLGIFHILKIHQDTNLAKYSKIIFWIIITLVLIDIITGNYIRFLIFSLF